MENTREILRFDGLSIEKLSDNIFLVREHDVGKSYGTQWKSSIVLVISDNECEVMAMSSSVSASSKEKLIKYFSGIGVEFIVFDRIKNGKMIKFRIKI